MTDIWTEADLVDLDRLIDVALIEDRVDEDEATLALFGDEERRVTATITAGDTGVFCGGPAARRVFTRLDPAASIDHFDEGAPVAPRDIVFTVTADALAVLGGERTALNFMSHLSGVATTVHRWQRMAGSVKVLDTRKTLPGWRRVQKAAVRVGGGTNHRADLAEFPMFKENHRDLFRKAVLPSGGTAEDEIAALLERLRARGWSGPVQIEVEDYESFRACLRHRVDWILIDNRTPETITAWIERVEAELPDLGGRAAFGPRLEASGGIDADTLSAYAASGVGRISLGALTHSVRAFDFSLHVDWE